MIYKLVPANELDEQRKVRGSGWHYNDFPPNMRECSPAEFWNNMSSYYFHGTEFRQPMYERSEDMPYGGHWGNLTLLYTDKEYTEGFAYTTEWDYTPVKARGTAPHDFWPRFFKFGVCIHEWSGMSVGRCLMQCTCKKCGKTYQIDSSD